MVIDCWLLWDNNEGFWDLEKEGSTVAVLWWLFAALKVITIRRHRQDLLEMVGAGL